MKRLLLVFAFVTAAGGSVAHAEFRQIDLSIFGMD
jgi:hypothetical protein